MPERLLSIQDFTVRFGLNGAAVLDSISFEVNQGESLAVVGESGAGKTTLARALIGMLPKNATTAGSLRVDGAELSRASDRHWQRFRGARIAMVPQEPELALNPVLTVRRQLDEVLRSHVRMRRPQRLAEAERMLAILGLNDDRIHSAYPHELSGGQRQRVVIAQALISKPAFLIADEPTSGLDPIAQADILNLLKRLKQQLRLTLLLITHNPDLLPGLTERVLVLEAGRVLETGSVEEVFRKPLPSRSSALLHSDEPRTPETQLLLNSLL